MRVNKLTGGYNMYSNYTSYYNERIIPKRNTVKKEIEKINVYTIRTAEKSVWSGFYVFFYFKDKESADAFIEAFNKVPNINIKFECLGITEQNNSSSMQSEINRNTKDYVEYYREWGVSFTKEHSVRTKNI